MKQSYFLIITLITTSIGFAQIPSNYYNSANGLTGYSLKTQLKTIISNGHEDQGYGALYDAYVTSDNDTFYENDNTVSKETLLSALTEVKRYLIDNFGSIDITLGDFQKLVRGDKEIPIWGLPDVITAMSSRPYKDGKNKVTQGESYIGLVRFNEKGPILESIISYGNSDNPDSDHYTDQMELYSKFKTKKMTFDKQEIYSKAKIIYNPN